MWRTGSDAFVIEIIAECRRCGAASARVVDVHGDATCAQCLRRADADPREKRRIMFGLSESLYW